MKSSRILLDMNGGGNKILVDEVCKLLIGVGLGFQPSASASRRRGAEIHQERFVFGPGPVQRCLNVFVPINCHANLLSESF
jgi:hypothetical protein